MSDVAELMKRCQRGVGGRNALDEAHDIMAECYGTLGRLEAECERLRVKLMTIAHAEPARHGIEWAKAHAAEGNNEVYAKWREAIDEAHGLRQQRDKLSGLLREVKSAYTTAIHWEDMQTAMAQIDAALSELTP